jgi:hypothetical protein
MLSGSPEFPEFRPGVKVVLLVLVNVSIDPSSLVLTTVVTEVETTRLGSAVVDCSSSLL